jgi:hypothetical protein
LRFCSSCFFAHYVSKFFAKIVIFWILLTKNRKDI